LSPKTDIFISHQKLTSIANGAIGEGVFDIKRIEVGVMTHKYSLISREHERYIIRFYPSSIKNTINFEPDLLIKAHKIGALVPEVICDSRGREDGYDYVIYRMLDGISLSESIRKGGVLNNELISSIFDNIHALNKVEVEKFGPLENGSAGFYDDWMSFVDEIIETSIGYIASLSGNARTTRNVIQFIKEFRNELSHETIKPCLIWNDISLDNIIVDKGSLSGFVDFDSAASGDSLMPLGYLYARQGESIFFKRLLDMYQKENNFSFDMMKFYAILRVMRISKYQSEPLPNGQAREKIDSVFPGALQIIKSF
jgi:aminoglycoside phosphotransferase (APT) family kinase protein